VPTCLSLCEEFVHFCTDDQAFFRMTSPSKNSLEIGSKVVSLDELKCRIKANPHSLGKLTCDQNRNCSLTTNFMTCDHKPRHLEVIELRSCSIYTPSRHQTQNSKNSTPYPSPFKILNRYSVSSNHFHASSSSSPPSQLAPSNHARRARAMQA